MWALATRQCVHQAVGSSHANTCARALPHSFVAQQLLHGTTAVRATSDASPSPSSASNQHASESSPTPKILVFGGSGFVGTRVCEQAVQMGVEVVSISRHGRPSWARAPWVDAVQWAHGDAMDPQQSWRDQLTGIAGVVSTLGAFGSNELMYKMCGTANMVLMDAAADAGVPRFAFISVHDFPLPSGWHAKDHLLKGYFQGKRDAEAHLARTFPSTGVALRPGFIYGTRAGGPGGMTIPLGLIGAPLAAALKLLPTKNLAGVPIVGAAFVPPLPVGAVGRAAASAVLDPSVPPGIMDVWTIASNYA